MEVTSRRRYHRSRRRRMRGFSPLLINSMQAEGFPYGRSPSSRRSGVPFVLLRAGPSASVSAEGQRGTSVVGHIHQEVRVRAERAMTIRMLVDTGATFSVVPRRLACALGIRRPRRSVSVRLADGRRVRLGADVAIIRIDGREAPATLLVGDVDEPILGVEALEALGLVVDPRKKRLSPSRPYAVRLGGYR